VIRLSTKNLSFKYDHIPVLRNVGFEIQESEIVSIVGPNGSGKSTLLKCINKILRPSEGLVTINGKDINSLSQKQLAKLVSYVPQNSFHIFNFTVFDIVLLGRRPHIDWSISNRDIQIVFKVLELIGISHLAGRNFDELSGGEKQKVIIARALCQEPQLLLFDEPTSNLDIKHQLEILGIAINMVKQKSISAVMALHDLNLASMFSDRIIMLKEGSIFTVGSPEIVLTIDNIKSVYEVETILHNESGKKFILPLSPIST